MAKTRKKNTRQVKPKIYIFCEGEKTEPSYIRAYITFKHPSCIRLKKAEQPVNIEKTKKNTPVQLVDAAIKFSGKSDYKNDQVWVVYDRESEHKYPDQLHKAALEQAAKNNIKVALSNVCFEYWLLLHLVNLSPSMSDCSTLISSPAFKSAFSNIGISKYDKKNGDEVAKLLMDEKYLTNARANAKHINQQSLKASGFSEEIPYKIKPYTNVYKLLDAIDRIAKA